MNNIEKIKSLIGISYFNNIRYSILLKPSYGISEYKKYSGGFKEEFHKTYIIITDSYKLINVPNIKSYYVNELLIERKSILSELVIQENILAIVTLSKNILNNKIVNEHINLNFINKEL